MNLTYIPLQMVERREGKFKRVVNVIVIEAKQI